MAEGNPFSIFDNPEEQEAPQQPAYHREPDDTREIAAELKRPRRRAMMPMVMTALIAIVILGAVAVLFLYNII